MSGLQRPGGWGNRDFHDEVPAPKRMLERGVVGGVVTAFTFVVMLLAVSHESHDCGVNCFDGNGILPREPGHAWTGYQNAWQWQAQWVLGVLGLVFAAAALGTATRYALRRWTLWLNVAAVLCAVAWIVWRVLEPPLPT